MKELNRDELLKVKGGEDIVEPDETDWIRGRGTSYSDFY
jgi:ATP-dependent protease HslVU (ClpYQ) peptidase subunit